MRRRRLARAAVIWGTLTLGGIVTVGVLLLWHLARRARLIRDGGPPPRLVRWPEVSEDLPDDRPEAP